MNEFSLKKYKICLNSVINVKFRENIYKFRQGIIDDIEG